MGDPKGLGIRSQRAMDQAERYFHRDPGTRGKLPKEWEEAISLYGRERCYLRSRKRHCGTRWSRAYVVAQGKEISEKPGSPVGWGSEGQVVNMRKSRSSWALG